MLKRKLNTVLSIALAAALTLTSSAVPTKAASADDYIYSFYFFDHDIKMRTGGTYDLGFYLDPYAFDENIHFKITNTTLLKFTEVSSEKGMCKLKATHALDSEEFDDGTSNDSDNDSENDSEQESPAPTASAAPDATPIPEPSAIPGGDDPDGSDGSDEPIDGSDEPIDSFGGANRLSKIPVRSTLKGDDDDAGSVGVGGQCRDVKIKAIYQGLVLDTVNVRIYGSIENGNVSSDSEYDNDYGDNDPMDNSGKIEVDDEDSTNFSDLVKVKGDKKSFTVVKKKSVSIPLTVTGKAKYTNVSATSSDARTATVGKITKTTDGCNIAINGVDAGKATIKLYYNDDGDKKGIGSVSITVKKEASTSNTTGSGTSKTPTKTAPKPGKVAITKVTVSKTTATVTWKKQTKNTTGYQVYVKKPGKSNYELLKKITKNSTVSCKATLTKGKKSYFKVRAYYSKQGYKTSLGAFSAVKSATGK